MPGAHTPTRALQKQNPAADPRFANLEGALGGGIYCADNFYKSNNYVTCPGTDEEVFDKVTGVKKWVGACKLGPACTGCINQKTGEVKEFSMLLCLVTLGQPQTTAVKLRRIRKPPNEVKSPLHHHQLYHVTSSSSPGPRRRCSRR